MAYAQSTLDSPDAVAFAASEQRRDWVALNEDFPCGWLPPHSERLNLPRSMGRLATGHTDWFNHIDSGAINEWGVQVGATCGLHAVNHLLYSVNRLLGRLPIVITAQSFEECVGEDSSVRSRGVEHYEYELLHGNLQAHGASLFPMAPQDLEGSDGRQSVVRCSRLEEPWADHITQAGIFSAAGYLMRLPSHGGHWIAVLPQPGANDALLADSLFRAPFVVAQDELHSLLLATALGTPGPAEVYSDIQWACFLVGVQKDR